VCYFELPNEKPFPGVEEENAANGDGLLLPLLSWLALLPNAEFAELPKTDGLQASDPNPPVLLPLPKTGLSLLDVDAARSPNPVVSWLPPKTEAPPAALPKIDGDGFGGDFFLLLEEAVPSKEGVPKTDEGERVTPGSDRVQ
jgi:hypothetical protein